ncbi:hypothetical protein L2D01_03800 [Hyphomonadaceae bacterium ML37]|nr:hypothetical protein L2D01_03800 [Hyphomonadaceae bacterium ML37]
MNAHEMIARYAHAVARRLPRAMRADVCAELEALLIDELEGRSGGGEPDEAAARALLSDFGDPATVALTYHTPAPVIDPRDAQLFGKITLAGLTALAVLAFSVALSDPGAASDPGASSRIADEAAMLALQGLGALLAVFWIVGAVRRCMLERAWSPRTLAPVRDPDAVNRPLMALAVGFWSAGLAVLIAGPAQVFDLATGGAAPAALIEAFTYDAAFVAERAPFLWSMLAAAIIFTAWQIFGGRRTPLWRRVEAVITVLLSLMLFQIVLAGDIFAAEPANQYMKLAMALFGGWGLIDGISALLRDWRERRTGAGGPVPF